VSKGNIKDIFTISIYIGRLINSMDKKGKTKILREYRNRLIPVIYQDYTIDLCAIFVRGVHNLERKI